MDKSKPFGLRLVKKEKSLRPTTRGGIFGSDSEDESTSSKQLSKIPQAKPIKYVKKEDLEDPSIYEYDAIYDEIKSQKITETAAPKEAKPSRYIEKLLKAADKRKKEYERRIEKKVQNEREKEGDEFEDKEMFVTSTYKKKLLEREEEEEKERRENQLNEMMDVTKQKDLSGFYRHFLKQTVGEEKIPEFGEKFAIKKEPCSDSDKEQQPSISSKNSEKSHNIFPEDRDDSDSDDSVNSESGEENSYEKSIRQYNNNEQNKENSSKVKNSKAKYRKRKFNDTESEDEIEPLNKQHSENSKKRPTLSSAASDESYCEKYENKINKYSKEKSLIMLKNQNEKESENSKNIPFTTESNENNSFLSNPNKNNDSDEESDSSTDEKELKKVKNDKEESSAIENEKKLKNIYEKRHVGDKFAEAQARYFQRLASRSS